MSTSEVADQAVPAKSPKTASPKSRKAWVPPAGFKRNMMLSSGKAVARVTYCYDTIDAKIKVVIGAWSQWYRGADGSEPRIQTVRLRVKTTNVTVKLADGNMLRARACCKPMDQFNAHTGKHAAIERLLRKNADVLTKDDRRQIRNTLCPGLARQIQRREEAKAKRDADKAARRAEATAKRAEVVKPVVDPQSNGAIPDFAASLRKGMEMTVADVVAEAKAEAAE